MGILLLAVPTFFVLFQYFFGGIPKVIAPVAVERETLEEVVLVADENPALESSENKVAPLASLNIAMAFYTQAPFSNWDYPWQEACEEASVLLVANEYNGMNLDRIGFNDELLRLVDWEKTYFGSYEHTTLAQTAEMLSLQYGLNGVIHNNPSFEDIQEILEQGHLIIAPFAGKLLGNPNFRNGGPVYHMSVIKGYDADKKQIVTHDVGTRNGENYVYSWEVLENALHDWHDTDILLGTPRILEVLP